MTHRPRPARHVPQLPQLRPPKSRADTRNDRAPDKPTFSRRPTLPAWARFRVASGLDGRYGATVKLACAPAGHVVFGTIGIGCVACSAPIVSPPASPIVFETVRPVPEGEVNVRGAFNVASGVFTGSANAGTLGARFGLPHGLELSADATAYRVAAGDQRTEPHVPRWVGAGRTALSSRTLSTDFFRPFVGFGGGYSALGGFISPDLGFVLAIDNPYCVPFLQARGGLSVPLAPRSVTVLDSSGGVIDRGRPQLTTLAMASLGVEFPLWRRANTDSLALGLSFLRLVDRDDVLQWLGLGFSYEAPLW